MNMCKYCQATENQIRFGRNKSGSQRYHCNQCSRTYTPASSRLLHSQNNIQEISLISFHNNHAREKAATYKQLTSLEICAGGGGQALGLEQAGFQHLALVEIESAACKTLRANRPNWNILEMDIKDFSATPFRGVDLLSGGVPCPPFSVAGQKLGELDERNLFDEAVRLVHECLPKAVMLENVKGLLESRFDNYRAKITQEIESLGYKSFWTLLNASDYGVPQLRPRTIFVALQNKYVDNFEWPKPNSGSTLTVGEALYEEISREGWAGAKAWRDAANTIAPTIVGGSKKHGGPDLGPTRAKKAWAALCVDAHGLVDQPPAKDFQEMPRLTVRMTATLQGFPKEWEFVGKKTPAYRQVGNAFPPPVAKAIGKAIAAALLKENSISNEVVETWQENLAQKQSYALTF